MHRVSAPDGLRADFRQTDVAYVPLLDEIRDGPDRVLDWHVRIEPRRTVDVDVVDAQALQRVGDEVAYRRRARIVAMELPRTRTAQSVELHADQHLIARPA